MGAQTHSKARKGFFCVSMTEDRIPHEKDWITRHESLFQGDFVPFRYFTHVNPSDTGIIGYWISWCIDVFNVLKQFDGGEESVTEHWKKGIDNADDIVGRLNAREERSYEARIKGLSLESLRRQYRLWNFLQKNSPMRTREFGLELIYAPVKFLDDEIKEKIADALQANKNLAGAKTSADKIDFGIPVTAGRLLARGSYGVVVRFNLKHLNIRTLLRAQLFSTDGTVLTQVVQPHQRVTDIFQYPQMRAAPELAISQHEHASVIFIGTSHVSFSEDTRIVFWFFRYPIEAKGDDLLDLPDELIPLAQLQLRREIDQRLGRPISKELEKEILEETEKQKSIIAKEGNVQNYYVTDTIQVSTEEIEKLALIDTEVDSPPATTVKRNYAPNLKYQDFHHLRFDQLYSEEKSQKNAYDRLVGEYPNDINPDGFDSFIVRWRAHKKSGRERK